MSLTAGQVSLFRKPLSAIPAKLWVPLLGTAWLSINVVLIGLGARHPENRGFSWSHLAGALDGVILSAFVIGSLSEKLHAASAGLLGGYGFQDVLNGYHVTKTGATWLHEQLLDPILNSVLNSADESFHRAVQSEILKVGGIAALVILSALVIQLIRGVGNKSPSQHR
ncbi:MAG TPA: hypothetical protein VEI73_09825 [Candidatus Acidoferrum sp.]|nr:hypothetical protein [Candidatus Acidoferrum sp.]